MNVSIIDIGTQSVKHYIFKIKDHRKEMLHYKRYSDANLGESTTISQATITRIFAILGDCLEVNAKQNVAKLKILGTDILRKAENVRDFTVTVKQLTDSDLEIISQAKEAQYLYDGFIEIAPGASDFAAVNIGGGSTELVVGDKTHLVDFVQIPFGVKFLRQSFMKDDHMDWNALDTYLTDQIHVDHHVSTLFVTGVLDFISEVGPHLGLRFEKNNVPNHPIKMSFDAYLAALQVLRGTPIDTLRRLYAKDPTYADNFAIGQSVYAAIAGKVSASTIVPSNNDLTDGVVYWMTRDN